MSPQSVSTIVLVHIFCSVWQSGQVEAGLTDYVQTLSSYFTTQEPNLNEISDEYIPQIPYEVSALDEKFISEAAKLTGVSLSELDSCQQRVVLRLKSDCDKMNDEQIAKMAVHLLNCQSFVEGRALFPCSEEMRIKDCTQNMDSDTWTSYHLMSNRARAVCYSIRQMQFRGLAEHTVNRLMDATQHQLRSLSEIAHNQENLQGVAEQTLDSLSKGHETLTKQQKDMQKAQFHGQLALEDNIRKLSVEKQMIVETHNHLVEMTRKIQDKLEASHQEIEAQTGESRANYQDLLQDLVTIQEKAQQIFDRIDQSSSLLLTQNEHFKSQYEETLRNLAEVNKTVHNLVTLVGGTRQALEERLTWLTQALGGTDQAVERLYQILWHSAFMMVSMLTCAFLSARSSTRIVVATVPPSNLAIALLGGADQYLDPLGLAAVLIGFVLSQTLLLWALSFKKGEGAKSPLKLPAQSTGEPKTNDLDSTDYGWRLAPEEDEDDFDTSEFAAPTPPLSRSGFHPRSRSNTPMLLNGSFKGRCHAKTRLGTACKLSSLPGRDFCHRHQTGDSIME